MVRVSNLMNRLGKAVPESARKLCQAEQTPFFDTATEDFSVAVLRGGGGEVRRARFEPEARFSDLLPGTWLLEILSEGAVVERRQIDLRAGDFRSYVVDIGVEEQPRGSGP